MKHFSQESFIKRVLASKISLRLSKRGKQTLGSLLIIIAVFGLNGAVVTQAQAPSDEEVSEITNFDSEEARAEALKKLAAEVKKIAADREQILWISRVLYSETKRSDEMRLIAEVLDNRVRLCHRSYNHETGVCDYKGAALAKSQFSGMHPDLDDNAYGNLAMNFDTVGNPAWDAAVTIAEDIYYNGDTTYVRRLPADTTHFFSPSVINSPAWAYAGNKVLHLPSNRFAFYNGII